MHKNLCDHPIIVDAEVLKNICKPLDLFNISTFAHARTNNKHEFSVIANHPKFFLHYIKNGYYHADISARNKPIGNCNYVMWDMLECSGKTKQMLSDAAEFDYRHIFTIVKKHESHADYYHFGTNQGSHSINQWYVNNLDKLQLFIHYFNEKISQSNRLAGGHQITFPVFGFENCQISESDFNEHNDQHFLSQVSLPSKLSVRQLQCVKFLIKGYTTKQIAQELKLSSRTVEDYLNKLKHKFKAKNKIQLVFNLINSQSLPFTH
ncbi:MAG: helix-turn-helix transcriptional regulator [Legionellaceae bacterium]|nr:helix-turn-helix transcriptional regulator [Legionellaceae bacterium]